MICSKRGGEGSKNLLHGWEGGREVLGGRGGETKGWEEDESSAGERERGREEGGDHSSPRSFSEGVAALRAGLHIMLISWCSKNNMLCDLWEDVEQIYRKKKKIKKI